MGLMHALLFILLMFAAHWPMRHTEDLPRTFNPPQCCAHSPWCIGPADRSGFHCMMAHIPYSDHMSITHHRSSWSSPLVHCKAVYIDIFCQSRHRTFKRSFEGTGGARQDIATTENGNIEPDAKLGRFTACRGFALPYPQVMLSTYW